MGQPLKFTSSVDHTVTQGTASVAALRELGRMVLLKLYICGFLNRVQSRCGSNARPERNVEVMWLLGRLAPEPSLETERTRPPCGFPYRSFLSTSSASLCHCLATSRNVSLASWSTVAAARARLLQLCGDTLPLCATWRSPLHLVERYDSLFLTAAIGTQPPCRSRRQYRSGTMCSKTLS